MATFAPMNMYKQLPNAITLLNLLLGFFAILLNDIQLSPLLILGAALLDLLDGLTARMLKAGSAVGAQLDALADLVSFGVAPAFLYYHHVLEPGLLSRVFVGCLVLGAAVRLAIFQVSEHKNSNFRGLPSPTAGLFIAFLTYDHWITQWISGTFLLEIIPLIIAVLMVVPVEMLSLKGIQKKPGREKAALALTGVLGLIMFLRYGWAGIAPTIGGYMILSWISAIIGKWSRSV